VRYLGNNAAQPTMSQALLKAGEYALLVACLNVDDPIRPETSLGDPGCEQIGAREAPERLALGAGARPVRAASSASADLHPPWLHFRSRTTFRP